MQIYLVGGAVRDQMLGLPVTERDWVVVNANVEQMLALGYEPVGKDFPVFLHPETHEEYALARTERKSGRGYKGFICDANPHVSLEEDLCRRDLTINAMAQTEDGTLIDPYGGQQDLQAKILRHVSPAFIEDPLRVLRVARFAANYAHLGFRIAEETKQFMRDMVNAGELADLVGERVWREIEKALASPQPQCFIETLRSCGALIILLPEIDCLYGIPASPRYHPEIDTGMHVMMALQQAALLTTDLQVRFAVLIHDIGKGLTPPEQWPSHKKHDQIPQRYIDILCERLKVPREYRELSTLVIRYHIQSHRILEADANKLLNLLEALDVFRRPLRLEKFLLACEADFRGRLGSENAIYHQAEYIKSAYQAAAQPVSIPAGLSGPAIGEAIRQQRLKVIEQMIQK